VPIKNPILIRKPQLASTFKLLAPVSHDRLMSRAALSQLLTAYPRIMRHYCARFATPITFVESRKSKSGHDVPYANSAPLLLADRMMDIWAVTLLASLSMSGFDAYRWHSVAVGTLITLISIPILAPEFVLSTLRRAGRSLPSCEAY
jgi:hypothetical protein